MTTDPYRNISKLTHTMGEVVTDLLNAVDESPDDEAQEILTLVLKLQRLRTPLIQLEKRLQDRKERGD